LRAAYLANLPARSIETTVEGMRTWGENPPTVYPSFSGSKTLARREKAARRARRTAAGLDTDGSKCYEPKDADHVGALPDPPEEGSVSGQRLKASLRSSNDVYERASGYGLRRVPEEMAREVAVYAQDLRIAARYDPESELPSFEAWLADRNRAAIHRRRVEMNLEDPEQEDLAARYGLREVRVLLNRVSVDVDDSVVHGKFTTLLSSVHFASYAVDLVSFTHVCISRPVSAREFISRPVSAKEFSSLF
jgi:hypothetical protein